MGNKKENKEVQLEQEVKLEQEAQEVQEKIVVEEEADALPPHVVVNVVVEKPVVEDKPIKAKVIDCIKLRLREGASLKSKELAQIPVDTEIIVYPANSTDSFYNVEYNGVIGYCLKTYIKTE